MASGERSSNLFRSFVESFFEETSRYLFRWKKKNVKKPYVPTYANCGCIVIVTVFYFSVNRENFFNLSVSCSAIISRMMNGTGKQWRSKQVVGMALAKGRESRGRQSRGRESRGAGAGVPEQGAPS